MSDTEEGRVCMTCGKAIADDDTEAWVMAEGDRGGSWARYIHADCAASKQPVIDPE